MKFRILSIIVIVFVVMVYSSNNAFCQKKKSELGGPPRITEIYGFWKKVNNPRLAAKSDSTYWPKKYQWFAFYENGKVYSMMTDFDANYTAKELKAMFDALDADRTPNYTYKNGMMIIDNKEINDYRELWGMNFFDMDCADLFQKGNLLMTLDDGHGQVVYYRLLKKIE